jgi:hypothetical protein
MKMDSIRRNKGGDTMEILTREDLRRLNMKRSDTCVSIYMPSHQAGQEIQQDPIRLRNLLNETERRLAEKGMRGPEAGKLLEPARDILKEVFFWRYQSEGLALFMAPGLFQAYRLPLGFRELVVISERFHLKPLLPLMSDDGKFYILSLSLSKVKIFEASRYSMRELNLERVPGSLAELLKGDEFENQLNFHTASWAHGGRESLFHGQGIGIDETKVNIKRFFKQIDKGLHELLREERAPLLVAGVDYLVPIFKEASTYAYLMEGGITGNPEELHVKDLHIRAREVVEPYFLNARETAASKYRQMAGTGLASRELQVVIPAAYQGRVESLFVAEGAGQWGRFDPVSYEIAFHDEEEQGDEDLLNLAALQSFMNAGAVYLTNPAKMPDNSPAAAVFRY